MKVGEESPMYSYPSSKYYNNTPLEIEPPYRQVPYPPERPFPLPIPTRSLLRERHSPYPFSPSSKCVVTDGEHHVSAAAVGRASSPLVAIGCERVSHLLIPKSFRNFEVVILSRSRAVAIFVVAEIDVAVIVEAKLSVEAGFGVVALSDRMSTRSRNVLILASLRRARSGASMQLKSQAKVGFREFIIYRLQ